MVDILIQPSADADGVLTNGIVIDDATLPLANQDAVALGLSLDTSYKFRVLGDPTTLTIATPAADPRTTAAAALYWYDASSVQHTAGTISAWNDKVSGGTNLAQMASIPMPTFNTATQRVDFDGTQAIGNDAFPFAQSMMSALDGGGQTTLWIVHLPADPPAVFSGTLLREGVGGGAAGNNTCMQMLVNKNASGTGADGRNRGTSAAFISFISLDSGLDDILQLTRLTVDQSTATININNGAFVSSAASVTPANFAASGDGFHIGGVNNGGSVALPFTGGIADVYASSTTDAQLITDITTHMMTQYGI